MIDEKKVDDKQKIGIAIERLLQDQPFFGVLLVSTNIYIEEYIPTAATDGKVIIFGKEFIKDLTINNTLVILLHEVLHIVAMHMDRKGNRDKFLWNVATDYAVNGQIKEIEDNADWKKKRYKLPEGALYDPKYRGLSSEEIYDKLPCTKMKCQHSKTGKGKSGQGNKQTSSGQSGQGKNSNCSAQQDGTCPVQQARDNMGRLDRHIYRRLKGSEKKDLQDKIVDAYKVTEKQQGFLPGKLKRQIKQLADPKIDWRREFQQYVGSALSNTGETFTQPSRRGYGLYPKVILPSNITEGKLRRVVIALDTSGSISQKEIDFFVSEVKDISSKVKEMYVMTCDTEIYSECTIRQFEDIMSKLNVGGYGGTDLRPPFKVVKEKRLNPKVFIYFSDLFGTFPKEKPRYPVVWVTPKNHGEAPWGKVITIND